MTTSTAPPIGAGESWRASPRASRHFFLLLLFVSFAAMCFLLKPVAAVLLFAAVLSATMTPLYDKLTRLLRGHRQISAIVFVTLFFLLVLLPVLGVVASTINDIISVSQSIQQQLEAGGFEALLDRVPEPIRERVAGFELDTAALRDRVGAASGQVLAATGAVLKATGDALFALVLLLFALVVFLTEGPRIVQWLDESMPLERGQTHEIFREFRKISTSVIVGNFGTSAIQSLVALAGYLIARAPSPLVLTLVTFLLSFVPAIGGAGFCLIVAAGLGVAGHMKAAIFLGIWAVAVVGVVDNVVKPSLVKRGVRLHGAIVFFAIIAGIAAFGTSGLFIGPLIVTFALTLVRIYRRDFKDKEAATAMAPAVSAHTHAVAAAAAAQQVSRAAGAQPAQPAAGGAAVRRGPPPR